MSSDVYGNDFRVDCVERLAVGKHRKLLPLQTMIQHRALRGNTEDGEASHDLNVKIHVIDVMVRFQNVVNRQCRCLWRLSDGDLDDMSAIEADMHWLLPSQRAQE